MQDNNTLYIVVPCYNEEAALPQTDRVLNGILRDLIAKTQVSGSSRILYVDDGSKDSTWHLIEEYSSRPGSLCAGVKLSRNRGHQNALWAGLMTAKDRCDMAISLDADLQDDPNAIYQFVEHYRQGSDIVYGVRCDRSSDTSMKRSTAQGYYKLLELLGVEIIYDHADYRLMSRRALEALSSFGEVNLFLRGIVPQLGFKTSQVEYVRNPRTAGESKYTLGKMLSLAADGVTSFSVRPLRLITAFSCGLTAVCLIMWVVMLILGMTITSAILLSIWSACALILLALSVIGEYIGRSYMELKHRPRYFISQYTNLP